MTSPADLPIIDAYKVSHLPPMEFSALSALLLAPVLFYCGRRVVEIGRRRGHGSKTGPTLIALSALLLLLSSAMPVATFLSYVLTVGDSTYITDAIAWAPAIALSAISWALPIAAMVLLGLVGQQTLAVVISCAAATYYVVFPLVYSSMQGRGLLGPGFREVIVVAVATLLFIELRERNKAASYVAGAAVFVVGIVSALTSVHWFNHIASLEFSSIKF